MYFCDILIDFVKVTYFCNFLREMYEFDQRCRESTGCFDQINQKVKDSLLN